MRRHPTAEFGKRVLDLAGLTCVLTGRARFSPAVALLVKLTSRGPAPFDTQTRVGRFGQPFNILSFARCAWTLRRMARFGRHRRLQSDVCRPHPAQDAPRRNPAVLEYPARRHVLRRPAPRTPGFVEQLEREIPFYHLRHLVPPGLTGWAQIKYRYGASVEDAKRKLAYDLYYVKYFGCLFDLGICIRTALAMAKGAR